MTYKNSLDPTKLKIGDKIVYSCPDNGTNADKDQCKTFLKLNETYMVKHFDMGGYHTDIWLEGVGFSDHHLAGFNSVMFQFADDRQYEVDDFWWSRSGYGPKTQEICNGCKAFTYKNPTYGGFCEAAFCSLSKKELLNCSDDEIYITPPDCPAKTHSIKGVVFD